MGNSELKLDTALAKKIYMNIGVPQGSVLETDLFIVFLDDLLLQQLLERVIAFAEGVSFLYVADESEQIRESISRDLDTLKRWCANKFMALNVSKPKI